MIAPQHPQNPIAYSFIIKTAIAPSSPPKPDRLFPQIKERSPAAQNFGMNLY
ncbi:MAG: hypothetical protein IM537_16415 [Pseudanabaena sp. M57BS1SP1A06MG]|nr:hypothetical protein [Pseudanabaena sp. M53BS1SP1A06MG]MCA6581428.1 hypothetical protein [Pseudanabaena sp. M34BS1SP1A06MG]MCA6591251.1 hypothetical protein [Pseudanabaena sp. M38BS1SP1A06MG]MCA6601737.1 hypothetical protein [Pseudanabaena sp. M57BS1SP1A06MG]